MDQRGSPLSSPWRAPRWQSEEKLEKRPLPLHQHSEICATLPPSNPGLRRAGAGCPPSARGRTTPSAAAEVIEGGAGAASALKMCYAAFTKGTTALLAAVRALAEHEAVDRALLEAWQRTLPDVPPQSEYAAAAASKAWRWSGEMEERLQRASKRQDCPTAFTLRRPRSTGDWKASRIALRLRR